MPFSTVNGLAVNRHRGWSRIEDQSLLTSRRRTPEKKVTVYMNGNNPLSQEKLTKEDLQAEDAVTGEVVVEPSVPENAKSMTMAEAMALSETIVKQVKPDAQPASELAAAPDFSAIAKKKGNA